MRKCNGSVPMRVPDTKKAGEPQPAIRLPCLSRHDSIGSVVLAASSSARASLFTRYGPPSARASLSPRFAKESATPSLSSQLNRFGQPARFNWIGRAGCVFFRKSFVVHSFRASIGPRLALASSCERIRHAIPFLPTESFRLRACLKMGRGCRNQPGGLAAGTAGALAAA